MRFFGLTATEFTLLFASAAGLAVFFYLLSFRMRKLVVATDPIWRQVAGRRRTPFRKLLALLGQILILFLLALALADPRAVPPEQTPPVAVVALVDVSASMGARQGDGQRLDEAKALLDALVDALGPRDRLMLLAMDDGCRPLATFSGDATQLHKAVAALRPGGLAEDFPAALNFALSGLKGSFLPDDVRRRLLVVSDRFHPLPASVDLEGVELEQVRVGKAAGNLAITAFDVRRRGGAAAGSELFVELSNHGSRTRQARLSIHTAEELLGEERVEIPARGRVSRSYFLEPRVDRRIMATLTPARGAGAVDSFRLDDRAFALVPEPRARRILLVSPGNVYLEMALKLDPSLEVKVLRPAAFRPSMLPNFQAAVFDGLCPASPIPTAYFHVPDQATAPACPFKTGERVEKPELLPLRGDHPVTEALTLVDVQVRQARRLLPMAGDVELLSEQDAPLVLAREAQGQRLLAFGFDVAKSDLPLRVAFPMLLHNIMSWFLGEELDLGFDENAVGQALRLPDWVDEKARIEGPDGRVVASLRLGGRNILRPRLPGFYVVSRGKQRLDVPVNFHNESESRLWGGEAAGPHRLLWASGQELPGPLTAGFDKKVYSEPPLQWPMILLVAAWLLLFDWVFFCFRILF